LFGNKAPIQSCWVDIGLQQVAAKLAVRHP
jgi:hypothetical protein